jgi:hypothetical protein
MEHAGDAILTIVFKVLRIVVEEAPTMLGYLFAGTAAGFVFGLLVIVTAAKIARRNRLLEIGSHYDGWIRRGTLALWLLVGVTAFSISGFFIGLGFAGEELAQAIVDAIQLPMSDYVVDKASSALRHLAINPALVGFATIVVPPLVCWFVRWRRPAVEVAREDFAPSSSSVARPARETVAAVVGSPAFAPVAAHVSAPSIQAVGLPSVGHGEPVKGSVMSLKVLETTYGPVFDFDVAAGDQRRGRVRWRAPAGSQLHDGDVVEVHGPVDANGILDAQTVRWTHSSAGPSPRWVWLALPPAIAGGSWLVEQERDLAWWWVVGSIALFLAARWKTQGVRRRLLEIVAVGVGGAALLLEIAPTELQEAVAGIGAVLTIPATIAAAALLVRHRLSRRRPVEATS